MQGKKKKRFRKKRKKKKKGQLNRDSLHCPYCITYSGQNYPQGNPSNEANTTLGTQAGNGSDKSERQRNIMDARNS